MTLVHSIDVVNQLVSPVGLIRSHLKSVFELSSVTSVDVAFSDLATDNKTNSNNYLEINHEEKKTREVNSNHSLLGYLLP